MVVSSKDGTAGILSRRRLWVRPYALMFSRSFSDFRSSSRIRLSSMGCGNEREGRRSRQCSLVNGTVLLILNHGRVWRGDVKIFGDIMFVRGICAEGTYHTISWAVDSARGLHLFALTNHWRRSSGIPETTTHRASTR